MARLKPMLWVLAIPLLVIFDQVTKYWVEETIDVGTQIPWIPDFLYITHTTNEGAAWGLFQGQMWFFYIMSTIALVIFGYFATLIDFKKAPVFSVAIVFLISGTIGNLIDRVQFGHVVDFIDVYIFSYNYPVFNVADILLTLGTIGLGIDILFLESKRKKG